MSTKHLPRVGRLLALFAVLAAMLPRSAHAYLDPGTGSYILQILVAALFGSLFALKMYWNNVTGFLRNMFVRSADNDDSQE